VTAPLIKDRMAAASTTWASHELLAACVTIRELNYATAEIHSDKHAIANSEDDTGNRKEASPFVLAPRSDVFPDCASRIGIPASVGHRASSTRSASCARSFQSHWSSVDGKVSAH
jgi:hypothetical protein